MSLLVAFQSFVFSYQKAFKRVRRSGWDATSLANCRVCQTFKGSYGLLTHRQSVTVCLVGFFFFSPRRPWVGRRLLSHGEEQQLPPRQALCVWVPNPADTRALLVVSTLPVSHSRHWVRPDGAVRWRHNAHQFSCWWRAFSECRCWSRSVASSSSQPVWPCCHHGLEWHPHLLSFFETASLGLNGKTD